MTIDEAAAAEIEAIVRFAREVFGSSELADQWLDAEHRLLGASPRTVLSRPQGVDHVRAILTKIAHGIPV